MIEVYDNLMSEKWMSDYYKLHFDDFAWYLREWTVNENYDPPLTLKVDFPVRDTNQFIHMFWTNDGSNSQYSHIALQVVNRVMEHTGITYSANVRVKSNYLMSIKRSKDTIQEPHQDDDTGTMVSMIYYLHDCDGDTVFFNNDGSLMDRVSPKRGRIAVFDSDIIHAAQNPVKNDFRVITNYVVKK